MSENLAEGFQRELNRNIDYLEEYIKIGHAGQFGAAIIKQKIKMANEASASGDVIRMLQAYEELKSTE